jgi:hypothetical protein
MRVCQQVLDVGADTANQLTQLLGVSAEDTLIQLSDALIGPATGQKARKAFPRKQKTAPKKNENPLQDRLRGSG